MSLDKKHESLAIAKLAADKKEEELMKKELNQAAEVVVQRINDKLRGTEFPPRWAKGLRGKKERSGMVSADSLRMAPDSRHFGGSPSDLAE